MAVPPNPPALARGSRYGADGVYYPAEEERTVPLSGRAVRLILYLYCALRHAFRAYPDIYVGADQFLYWVPGNTRKRVAPDGYVIRGVPREPPRAVIRLWEEAIPSLVIEVSSEGSRGEDRGHKFLLYQDVLRCPEYLIFDDDTEELLFYRRIKGTYQLQEPDADGRYFSPELGIWFAPDPENGVRVFDLEGAPIAAPEELGEAYEELDDAFEELEQRYELLDDRFAALDAQYRSEQQQAAATTAELTAEVERLRAEIERLKQGDNS